MSDFMSYDDIMKDLANDRDDSNDPEYRDPHGYCEHGVYVGGSGIDWTCQWCEDGISVAEARKIVAADRLRAVRGRAERAETALNILLAHGVGGIDAAEFAQNTSYIGNPLTRYGRH